MIWIDVIIVAAILLSAIVGFFRGFVREVLGLASWILALYLAFTFAGLASDLLEPWIDTDSARLAVGFGIVFLTVLILGAILNFIIGRLVSGTGFAGTDRAIGGAFGVLRGIAVLILLTLLAGFTAVPRDDWWQESSLLAHLEDGALWARQYLPEDLANSVSFPRDDPQTAGSAPSADAAASSPVF